MTMLRALTTFLLSLTVLMGLHAQGNNTYPRNEEERRFMEANVFLFRTPEGMKPYSTDCIAYNEQKIDSIWTRLAASGLPADFAEWFRAYTETSYLYQRLNGPRTLLVFGPSAGLQAELPAHYYDFLRDEPFDDARMLSYPKWFETLKMSMEEMERAGMIEVDNDHYLSVYARRIGSQELRSTFLTRFIDLQLQMGYYEDIAQQIGEVTAEMPDTAVATVRQKVEELRGQTQVVARGATLPPFTAYTVDGQTFQLSDYAGKAVLLDFWYTGCIPCKAEAPYLEALAQQFREEGAKVQIVSVSLDTGDQLMAAWRKAVESKPADHPILNVNLPGGFRSDLVKELGIHSVPRMILVGADGKIVSGFAKRPSDAKLRQEILTALSARAE